MSFTPKVVQVFFRCNTLQTEFALHRNLLNFLMSEADKVSGL